MLSSVYIHLCSLIGISDCEAHFSMIVVAASVCQGERVILQLRAEYAFSMHVVLNWHGGCLFDDLWTVTPGFGLSFC